MRAFVAVVPPEHALAPLRALVDELRPAYAGTGWVAPERWHVTLAFLGEVTDAQVARLDLSAVTRVPPFRLAVAGGGCFPSVRRPHVCWAGLTGDVAALTALAAGVAGAARTARIPLDRKPFRPHVTLARVRRTPVDGEALVARLAGASGPEWLVDEVVLLRSHLGPQPRYDRLRAWPLLPD